MAYEEVKGGPGGQEVLVRLGRSKTGQKGVDDEVLLVRIEEVEVVLQVVLRLLDCVDPVQLEPLVLLVDANRHFSVDDPNGVVSRVDLAFDSCILSVSGGVWDALLEIFYGRKPGSRSSEHGLPDLSKEDGRPDYLLSLTEDLLNST